MYTLCRVSSPSRCFMNKASLSLSLRVDDKIFLVGITLVLDHS